METVVIKNVSKVYKKGPKIIPNLRDWIYYFTNKQFQLRKGQFYALNNISLTVKKGESIGIIGSNGAGKSTLLKLIARVTYPTHGEVITNGRIAGLLELGAGFHPELTGEENIFFQSAILGMKKKEIQEKYEKIVSFSGLKNFIDTPIKYYSSGMYARLGFSVAVMQDPDILLIDEVLSVGDEAFRKKCIKRVHKFFRGNKTVIYVSHNLASVKELCNKVYWLKNGKFVYSGEPGEVIEKYLKHNSS